MMYVKTLYLYKRTLLLKAKLMGHKTVILAIKYTKIQMMGRKVVLFCFHWIFGATYYQRLSQMWSFMNDILSKVTESEFHVSPLF